MKQFNEARIKLTIWYILISFAMLFVFSLAAIGAENKAFSKIQTVLGNKVQRPHLTRLLEQRINNFELDFIQKLFYFDVILLGFSAGASWFLSGKTLQPIKTMVKNQEAFAADVSHELRTPLTTVKMEIESIKRTTKNIPQTYLFMFKSIEEEVQRMTKLVENLLLMVRTNNNNTIIARQNLSEIVEQTSKKLGLQAKEKNISYLYHIENNITVKGDEDELKRLVSIFIDNSLHYTPAAGNISIKLVQSKNVAVLTVSDTGIGISAKDIPHIFERFYRASCVKNSKEINYKGTGLGLSIAHQIVQRYGGSVTVNSTVGKGTLFSICLPSIS